MRNAGQPELVPCLSAVLVCLASATALAGWLFGVPILQSIRPDWPRMQFLSAVCFLLAGGALAAVLRSRDESTSFRFAWLAVVRSAAVVIGRSNVGRF